MSLLTILVEDSPVIQRSLIPAMAESADVHVIVSVGTAEQGISALRDHADRWQVAVVDMLLQAGNGLQVLRAGRERRLGQHMIVLTNYATQDIRRKSLECGADAVFDKSTEIDQFLELCRHYSAEQTAHIAHAPGAPASMDDQLRDHRPADDVDNLIERVAIDRLLTEAVSASVHRNSTAIHEHLARSRARKPSAGSFNPHGLHHKL